MVADRTNHPAAPGLTFSMPIRARRLSTVILLVALVVLLFAIPLHSPPDGQDRAEFAQFVGRFHPLVVHLPIALLLLVPILELGGLTKRWSFLSQAARFILPLAALSAVAAVSFGWLLAWSGGYEGRLILRHMWGGVTLATATIACCFLRKWNLRLYAGVLAATVILMAWTSDQGGKITHGEKYLTEFMPNGMRSLLGISPETQASDSQNRNGSKPALNQAGATNVANPPDDANSALASLFAARVQPILADKCVTCHNANKHKSGLRLDSFEQLMRGSKHGAVIVPGSPQKSELYRRITLSPDEKDFMPADGKPRLTPDEVKVIEVWLSPAISSNPATAATAIQSLPPIPPKPKRVAPLAPDYRPRIDAIAALEASLGIKLMPRSQNPTDGLVVRTVSAPERCTNQTLASLEPVADLIVDAELARTKIDDEGVAILANFSNLRSIDLSHTAVTSQGVQKLSKLEKIESLNLTETAVDDSGVSELRHKNSLKNLYLFGTRCTMYAKIAK